MSIGRTMAARRWTLRRKSLRWASAGGIGLALFWPSELARQTEVFQPSSRHLPPITAQVLTGVWTYPGSDLQVRLEFSPRGSDAYDITSVVHNGWAGSTETSAGRARAIGLGDRSTALLLMDRPIPPFSWLDARVPPFKWMYRLDPLPSFTASGYFVVRYQRNDPSAPEREKLGYWWFPEELQICPLSEEILIGDIRSGQLEGTVVTRDGRPHAVVSEQSPALRAYLGTHEKLTRCRDIHGGFAGVRRGQYDSADDYPH